MFNILKGSAPYRKTRDVGSGGMKPTPQLRWGLMRDMDQVCAIENASFSHPWPYEEFADRLRQRNCILKVAYLSGSDIAEPILGYCVFELHATKIVIANLAVATEHRFQGIGRMLVQDLIKKLSHDRRRRIQAVVSERNLAGQLWLNRQGFIATKILPDYHVDGSDGYRFEFYL